MRRFILLALVCLLLPINVAALEVPKLTGYVNDLAEIISPATELKIEHFLRGFESSDSTQLVIDVCAQRANPVGGADHRNVLLRYPMHPRKSLLELRARIALDPRGVTSQRNRSSRSSSDRS